METLACSRARPTAAGARARGSRLRLRRWTKPRRELAWWWWRRRGRLLLPDCSCSASASVRWLATLQRTGGQGGTDGSQRRAGLAMPPALPCGQGPIRASQQRHRRRHRVRETRGEWTEARRRAKLRGSRLDAFRSRAGEEARSRRGEGSAASQWWGGRSRPAIRRGSRCTGSAAQQPPGSTSIEARPAHIERSYGREKAEAAVSALSSLHCALRHRQGDRGVLCAGALDALARASAAWLCFIRSTPSVVSATPSRYSPSSPPTAKRAPRIAFRATAW